MDNLPWSRWHLDIITALGTSWLLDGLQVTLVGSLFGILESKRGLFVNATFWVGAALGALASMLLLNGHFLPQNTGWRYAFGIGGTLGLLVLLLRLRVPESPLWLMLRGREKEADQVVCAIEDKIRRSGKQIPAPEGEKLKLTTRDHTPLKEIFANLVGDNRQRSFLGFALMVAQSFFFNAIFFTYPLIAKRFFHLADRQLPLQLLPFAIASFLGPLVLGPLFDKLGRKPMIVATYAVAGVLLAAVGLPFTHGSLGVRGLSICFSVIFFVASSAASAAYLTVSEIFPLELCAIAIFYALGTLAGGVGAPYLFGLLINSGSRANVS